MTEFEEDFDEIITVFGSYEAYHQEMMSASYECEPSIDDDDLPW